jgi:hypothetical protein
MIVWPEEVRKTINNSRMSLSSSRHSAAKQMHYKVGVDLMVKIAKNSFIAGVES